MKLRNLISITVLFLICLSTVLAQQPAEADPPSAADDAVALRMKLLEVQDKEGALQTRVQLLDNDLKPENIERAVSGYGSTRPEELREQRRRELEIEKKSALAQLEQLAISRARLEAAIATADSLAYQQSAKGFPQGQMAGLHALGEFPGVVITGVIALIGLGVLLILALRYSRKVT